jgi:hypothetical protein
MKRNEIVQRLMVEGFSPKTLVNMTDKQLNMLSVRILSEGTVMIPKDSPTYVADVEAAKKSKKTIETYEGEVKEDLKGDQKKLDKNHNGKIDSQDFKILKGKKKEVKEGRCGKCDCEECECEKKEVNEWVDSLVENQYYSFTSKNEIMEMISTKLNEQGPAIAEPDIDVEPDIREPKVNPDQDPFIDPWENPNEGPDPSPKFKKDSSDLPDFMKFKDIINSFN